MGLQRAKQEAVAKADAQNQRASTLHMELEKLTTEKARYVQQRDILCMKALAMHHAKGSETP